LATFTKEIQALEEETGALISSLTDLSQNVDTMSETLDTVEAQTERATTFFERLQQMLQEIFEESPAEPESAAPQTAAPDLEVGT
jgi:chromosome segregation ATPase